jgi:hypothetical protein
VCVPFTVLYDANVLYPMSLRDLLVRIGQTPLVRVCWTDEILAEWVNALTRRRPELDLDGQTLGELVVAMAADKRRPPMTSQEVVASLRAAGLARSADPLLEIVRSAA